MKTTYSYTTKDERENILDNCSNIGYKLIGEEILVTGNFLVFDTNIEKTIKQLETALIETSLLLASEQLKNQQNEQAILELTTLMAGGAM